MREFKFSLPQTRRSFVLAVLLLTGCAAQQLHTEGMELMAQGRYPEAISKLDQASKHDPEDMSLRRDLERARELASERYLAAANSARLAGQYDRAEAEYRNILKLDPLSDRAQSGLTTVAADRRHTATDEEARALFAKGDLEGALLRLQSVFLENPNDTGALALQRQIEEKKAKDAAAAPSLKAMFKKPVTLQFRDAGLRMVFESIARTSGINILLDKDIRAEQKVSIFVKDTSVENVIELIMLQNQLAKKVLSDNTIFIYPNQPAKEKDYQDLQVRSFHLVYADAKQIQTMLKTILKTKDMFVNEKTNSIIMRDTPEAVQLAEKMIVDQDVAEPEVMLEVEVLQVSHTLLRELGIQYPDSMTLTAQPLSASASTSGTSGSFTWNDLKGQTLNNLLVSPIPSVTLNAHLDDSDTDVLATPRIRAKNHEKAKILIGDRTPIITNSVTPVSTGTPVVTGSVQYVDTGLKLDVEPDIHSDGEVGIKVNLEVSSITGYTTSSSGSSAPNISTKTASTVLQLRDGETDVLAGLIDNQTAHTSIKIPGLGEIPALGRLFSSHTNNDQKSEIVLSITPRIMGKTVQPDAQNLEYWTGTETNLRSQPFTLQGVGSVDMSGTAPAAAPAGTRPPMNGANVPQRNQGLAFTWQGPMQARVGEKITVTLNAQSPLESVRAMNVAVNFDPSVLKAVDAVQGSFMRGNNVSANFSRDIGSGTVSLNLEDSAEQGAKGPGSIAAMTFEVIGPGSTEISLGQVSPAGAGGASINVTPPVPFTLTAVGAPPAPAAAAPAKPAASSGTQNQ